ncbi:C-GCAxxG-C-C family protein [Maridesulfovibrio sp.]|uniref:C-GCAxxG-C-C family protein n=1 Tax=Maridesulfovibrio sp. TaxID=2795000 RepID=UPI002A1895F2|nr:C-GCAxxG-C-C family protein [Maridesulfovibrio sp.]
MNCCNRNTCGAADKAGNYFLGGYHCAEAVVRGTLEHAGMEPDNIVRYATPFGGGYGKTFQEACGALSGALIVIGHLHGRNEAGQSWDYPAALAEMIRDKFLEKYGTTKCINLRGKFGPEAQLQKCSEIVSWISREILNELELEN